MVRWLAQALASVLLTWVAVAWTAGQYDRLEPELALGDPPTPIVVQTPVNPPPEPLLAPRPVTRVAAAAAALEPSARFEAPALASAVAGGGPVAGGPPSGAGLPPAMATLSVRPTLLGLAQEPARTWDESEVDGRPVPVGSRALSYPEQARALGVEGLVRVRALVDASGVVVEVQVRAAQPTGVFDSTAVSDVRGWRFEPATVGGLPVPCWVELELEYALQ